MFSFLKKLFGAGGDEALRQALAEGAFLVDVRTPGEFASGSVSGAVNIPLNEVKQKLKKFKGKKSVVVFCRSGMRAAQAKSILEQNGISPVFNGRTVHKVNSLIK